jgi:predicted ATP-dependent serine protease
MPSPWLNAGKLPDIEALEKRIKALGITLVIIDNLGLISPSSAENSDEMIIVMSHLRLLAERTGAAIVVIHHQRKSSGIQSRAGESIRGHSSIESAVDLALRVDREADSDFITIQSTKSRDCVVPVFGCEFRYEHKRGTTELLECCFFKTEVKDTTSSRAIENCIISTVESKPGINQGRLVSAVNELLSTPKSTIRKLISSLVKRHRIKIKSGAKGAMLYFVE